MLCYCRNEIKQGDRRIVAAVYVDWGQDDERENQPAKTTAFCSFQCFSDWAKDRAADHDNRVVVSGDPDEQPPSDEPVVDTRTESLIRKESL